MAGIIVNKKRCRLSPQMVDIMVFLNKNAAFLGLSPHAAERQSPEPLFRIPEDYNDDDEEDASLPPLPTPPST